MATTLLVPVMNEIDGLKAVMPRVKKEWVDEILVVDGGSTDGSLGYCREQGYRIVNQTRKGITGAYEDALPHISGDIVVTFSPDGNSIPEVIPDLISKIDEGYDMVIGSRYLPGAKSEDDDIVTRIGNRIFTMMINRAFGGHYTDTLVMMRAWRKRIFKPAGISAPRAGFETILSIRCAKKKFRVAEIPASEPKRIGGERKMQPIKNGIDILRVIFYERLIAKD